MDKLSVHSARALSQHANAEKARKDAQHEIDIRDTQYKTNILDTLKNIEKNTAVLNELVLLVRASNVQQETLTEIVSELLEIAKAKNKDEAASQYKKAMKRITDVVHDAESIGKMASIAGKMYDEVLKFLS
ncbi:hypothetical protein [Anaerospora hongkongensis]|uniref:hypothetical protein n=1 Tax=Anaerospora hongkongensis TaxID=244830 RepID=UPI002FD9B9FC